MDLGNRIAQLFGRRRSPVKLFCKRPFAKFGDDMLVCHWKCRPGIRGAQFRHRKRKDLYVILHRSTRSPGKWQLTSFDSEGPIGDIERSSCDEALRDGGISEKWKLEAFESD